MSDEGIKSTWRCAACGRENPATAVICSLCLTARAGAADIVAGPGPVRTRSAEADEDYPRPPPATPSRLSQRRLTGTLLIVACVLLIPLFGSGLALLAALTPALIRLFRADSLPAVDPLAPQDETMIRAGGGIAAAAGVTLLVILSSLITFVAVCLPGAMWASMSNTYHEDLLAWWLGWIGGVTLGMLAAGGVGYSLVHRAIRKDKQRGETWEPPIRLLARREKHDGGSEEPPNTDIRP